MKYLKLFETHTEYQTYINSQDRILPNVSYCEDNNEVHYKALRNDVIEYVASQKLSETTISCGCVIGTDQFNTTFT